MNVNEQVNEAFRRWAVLVGLDPDVEDPTRDDWKPAANSPWHKYAIIDLAKDLNRSRQLDPSGLTAFMLLRGITEHLLREVQFTAYDIVLDPAGIEDQIAPMRALRDVLEHPDVVQMIEGFQGDLRSAADHYDYAHRDALEHLLADKWDLANVRRDSLRSIEDRLHAHQFTWGQPDSGPVAYNPDLYEFWNVNSILAAMRAQKVSGISVCLVRDPRHVMASYFVFAVRNGTTMTILTDQDKTPHPAFNRMARRPDRDMSRRSERNWFPYDLLDLEPVVDADGNLKGWTPAIRDQLVPIQAEAVPIKPIRELRAEEFVWTVLMFDLIRDKYWTKNLRLPELSYTGQMVVDPGALVGANAGLARSGDYVPLELPPIKASDVTAEATESQWKRKPTGFNRWMVERYAHRVPEGMFNLVGTEQAERMLQGPLPDALGSIKLEALEPCSFGSKRKIEEDRLWVARMNQMRVIQKLAMEEFEAEHDAVLKWYTDRIHGNWEMLVDACAVGELVLPDQELGEVWARELALSDRNVLRQRVGSNPGLWAKVRLGDFDDRANAYRCFLTDRIATVFTDLRPTCPAALAVLCGCEVGDLPWPLQHWFSREPYSGNCILDRLDPEDWVLLNPWRRSQRHRGIPLDVGIYLSKSALHARRKLLGLPRKVLVQTPAANGWGG